MSKSRFTRIATVLAALVISASAVSVARSQIYIGGNGAQPVILGFLGCANPGQGTVNNTDIFSVWQADCDETAVGRGYKHGVLQPVAPGKNAYCPEKTQQYWVCSGVPGDVGGCGPTQNCTAPY